MFEEGKPVTPRRVVKWLFLPLIGWAVPTIATGTFAPQLAWVSDKGTAMVDAATCGGRAAMMEGDRLSEAASRDVKQAQSLFREANAFYSKAYACGFADAGIRLAVGHCMGLGAGKDLPRARQIILDVEGNHPTKAGRAGDARKLCGF